MKAQQCLNIEIKTSTRKVMDKIGDKYEVEIGTLKNSRLMVVRVNTNLTLREIEEDIVERNFSNTDAEIKTLYSYTGRKKSSHNWG